MTLSLATSIADLNAEICDRGMQCMFPDKDSGDPVWIRYVCARCGAEGDPAFGAMAQMTEVRDTAEALFPSSMACEALE